MTQTSRRQGRAVATALLAAHCTLFSFSTAWAQGPKIKTIEAGTVLPAKLNDTLSSKDSRAGDGFTATIRRDSSDYYSQLPDGTKIEGVVNMVRARKDKDPGELELHFLRIRLPSGRSVPIEGSLIGLDNKSVDRSSDGRLIAKPGHKTDRLTYVGYGAAAGFVLSLFTHKTLENTALGAGLGYLFGALQKSGSEPHDVLLKPGTEIGVRLDSRVVLSGTRTGDSGDSRNEEDRYDEYGRPLTGEYRRPADKRKAGNRAGDSERRDAIKKEAGDEVATGIGVMVGDQNVNFDSTASPVLTNGAVLVPYGPVLKAARVKTEYDAGGKVLKAISPDGSVRVSVGSAIAVINGTRRVRLQAAVQRLNGTVYVPLRFLELATGQTVTYDSGSRTVIVNTDHE